MNHPQYIIYIFKFEELFVSDPQTIKGASTGRDGRFVLDNETLFTYDKLYKRDINFRRNYTEVTVALSFGKILAATLLLDRQSDRQVVLFLNFHTFNHSGGTQLYRLHFFNILMGLLFIRIKIVLKNFCKYNIYFTEILIKYTHL